MNAERQDPQQPPVQQDPSPTSSQESPNHLRPFQRRRQKSVIHYMLVLFAAAFVLLLITFLMEQRRNEALIEGLHSSITGLQQSASAMHTVEGLYAEKDLLEETVDVLENRVASLERDQEHLIAALEQSEQRQQELELGQQALDWFWQINEAYVRGKYTTARNLIRQLEELGLVAYLPQDSHTNNGRFSPLDRYHEICDRVN